MNADAVSSVDKANRYKRRENDSEERLNKLLTAIFAICDASDFHIEERIVMLRISELGRFGGSAMSKKKGRPKKDFAREYQYRVRLSLGDIYTLEYIQEVTGKTKAEIFRDGLKAEYEKARRLD